HVLLLLGLPRLLGHLELVLPVVHDADDRRTRGGCHFDEIESCFVRHAERRVHRHDAELDTALRRADEAGLNLVEVAPTARPPVVRIMDYGKYKFEMAKQARMAKKKQHVIELKEVKYRPGIDDHDFDTKTRHARRFLEEKNKVKVTMMFRGRQVAHPELGQAVLERVATALADIGKIESAGRLEGKSMTMILAPK